MGSVRGISFTFCKGPELFLPEIFLEQNFLYIKDKIKDHGKYSNYRNIE